MKDEKTLQQLAQLAVNTNEEGLPFREYWQVVRKRIWTILLVCSLVLGLGTLYLINQKDVFQAAAIIEIRTESPQVLGGDIEPVIDPAAGARYWSTEEYYETQYRIIRSRAVASEVVRDLMLAEDLDFLGIHSEDPEQVRIALEDADPIDRLIGMISVSPIPDSHLVRLAIEHEDPDFAAELVNTLAEVYVSRNQQRQLRGTEQAFHWLENERASLRDYVQTAEETLLQFRQDNGIRAASLSERQEQLTEHLNSINSLTDSARAEVQEARVERRAVLRAQEEGDLDAVPIQSVIGNPLIQSLKQERESLRTELARLEARYGDRHQDIRGVRAALEGVETAIQREIGAILDSYNVELRRAEARLDELEEEHQRLESEVLALSQAEPTYNQLLRDIDHNAEVLQMIERRYKETDLYRRQRDVNNIEILDRAIVPDVPIRPRKRIIMGAALLLGIIVSLGFAFLLELLDNTVRTQEDVERLLGFTFLGVVPSIKLRARERRRARANIAAGDRPGVGRDLFVHNHPKSSVAECCRSIRTNLHFMSPDKELRKLLVTSAGPREGKTSTAINLAMVMAQSNHKVLLVDSDMRRPRIHKAIGLDNDIGLSNLILGEVDYDTAIKPTEIPNLDTLVCGPIPPNPTELMHTKRFQVIVDELSKRYDRVIFDSPPVIAVADAIILGNAVDGVLFVIKSGQTSKEVVKRAKSHLEATNAPLLGAILNDLDLEDRAYRYHYYYSYYYRYGQYYETELEPDEEQPVEI